MEKALVKIRESGSHFEVLSVDQLRWADIVQIYPVNVFNSENEAGFLCEVMNDDDDLPFC